MARASAMVTWGLLLGLGACASERTQVQGAPAGAAAGAIPEEAPPVPVDAPTVLLTDLEGDPADAMAAHTLFVQRGLRAAGRARVVLKREQDELLASCDSEACLERVRAELGAVRYLASGGVGRLGDATMVRLRLVEPATGTVVARVLKQGPGPLEGLLLEAGRELGQAVPAPAPATH